MAKKGWIMDAAMIGAGAIASTPVANFGGNMILKNAPQYAWTIPALGGLALMSLKGNTMNKLGEGLYAGGIKDAGQMLFSGVNGFSRVDPVNGVTTTQISDEIKDLAIQAANGRDIWDSEDSDNMTSED